MGGQEFLQAIKASKKRKGMYMYDKVGWRRYSIRRIKGGRKKEKVGVGKGS
jgi:hypothetical protein